MADSTEKNEKNKLTRDLKGRQTTGYLLYSYENAESAVMELKNRGFSGDEIGILMRPRSTPQSGDKTDTAATSPLDGLPSLISGPGTTTFPGVGEVITGGLLGNTFGSSVTGDDSDPTAVGISSALIALGIPEKEAKELDHGFHHGNILVVVKSDTRLAEAADVLSFYQIDNANSPHLVDDSTVSTNVWTEDANGRAVKIPIN
jgi:hypothetical protein